MDEQEPCVLVCMRVRNQPVPAEQSTMKQCGVCNENIWVGRSSFATISKYPNMQYRCQVCIVADLIRESRDEIELYTADPRFQFFADRHKEEFIEVAIKQGTLDALEDAEEL